MRAREQAASTSNIRQQRISRQMGFTPDVITLAEKDRLDQLLISMLVHCAFPFSCVMNPAFISYHQALRPAYVLPSRKVVSQGV